MTRLLHQIVSFLLKPFQRNLSFFLKLWALISVADIFFWSLHGNPRFGLYMGLHGLIYSYVITLIVGLFRGRFEKGLKVLFYALGIINLIGDTFAHYIMHSGFTGDMVAVILGTNWNEGTEFMGTYLTPAVTGFLAATILSLPLIDFLVGEKRAWHKTITRYSPILLGGIVLLSTLLVFARRSKNWETVFLHKIALFASYEKPEDLEKYRTSPTLECGPDAAKNIVLIIGESLSKTHCSLYGYDKQTMPWLSGMAGDSLLFVFDSIKAPYIRTGGAFRRLMTDLAGAESKDDPWYRHLFLADAAKAAGYQTIWISNQSSAGIWDNEIATIAELFDSIHWIGAQGVGIQKNDLDEVLLSHVQSMAQDNGDRKTLYVIHLMGQHEAFFRRYSSSFAHFTPDDYADRPEGQRKLLSEYDNAVLYGDWVVSRLMDCFRENEAVVFFFPDHSLDLFDSDPTYAGHARDTEPVSVDAALNIPFFVFPTEKYRTRFPKRLESIKDARHRPFNTEDMFYTFLDLADARLAGGDAAADQKSLFFNK